MKPLVFKRILPLSALTFFTITRWQVCAVVDAPDTDFIGFPFSYMCDGWHTSMSNQVFIVEMVADFFIYFAFWLAVFYGINRYIQPIQLRKIVTIPLLIITTLVLLFAIVVLSDSNNIYYTTCPHNYTILNSGLWLGGFRL